MAKKRRFRLVGRDAGSGRFKTVKSARKDKKGSIVQRIPIGRPRRKKR
jgi:hypothetical protein